jgi:hypothetical protein
MKVFTNKLAICVVVVASFVGVADAAQVIAFEAPLDDWNQGISANFAANRELGRAWIDVRIDPTNPIGEELSAPVVIPKAVEGLYYDPARKQVLYRTATETVVCAEDATFLWSTYLKNTGQCLLSSRTEQRKMDDGFKIRERTVATVVFEARTSSASQHAAAFKEPTRDTTVGK